MFESSQKKNNLMLITLKSKNCGPQSSLIAWFFVCLHFDERQKRIGSSVEHNSVGQPVLMCLSRLTFKSCIRKSRVLFRVIF